MQVQSVSENEIGRLKLAISGALSERCSCPFAQENIADGQFSCNHGLNAEYVLFQGRLISMGDIDSVELLFYMQEWLLTEPTIALDGFSLHAAENCQVYSKELVNSTYDNNCEWPPNTLRECRRITTGVSIAVGLLALMALSTLAVVVVICICQRYRVRKKFM